VPWGKILLTGLQVLAYLLKYASEAQLLKAGEQKALLAMLTQQQKYIDDVLKAGAEQAKRNAAVPTTDSLPDDGFRRD